MFRCKVMAFRVSDFYIGLLEYFKKSLRRFQQKVEVWGHFLLIYWFKLYQTFLRSKITCNETITTYFGCLVTVSLKIWDPEIHSLTCEMKNPMQYSWHWNFHHRAYKFRNIFFRKNMTTDMSHLTWNTTRHIIKYLCLSMFFFFFFFVAGLPNLATLTIKIFNHFIKKHLIKFKHVNLFQNF